MKKVLLVIPPEQKTKDVKQTGSKWPRLGVAYIAAYLREHGVGVRILDCKAEEIGTEEAEDIIAEFEPDVVAVSAFTEEIVEAAKICEVAKKIDGKILTVMGGPHASAIPEETLEEFRCLDVAVYGEGEETLREIVEVEKSSDFENIDGIVYRKNEKVIRNKPRAMIKDIDSMPYPAWDLFPLHQYRGRTSTSIREKKGNLLELPILSVRGCPYNCNFCYKVYGRSVRLRDPKNVVDEIEFDVNEYGATQFLFVEGTFGVDRRQSLDLCKQIIERKLNEKIKWIVETRVDVVTEELLTIMKQAGCTLVGFGVESGNQQILKQSGKGISREQVKKAVSLAKNVGLSFECYFIMGHPNETISSIQDSINFAKELDPELFNIGIMIPYPGTAIREMAKKGEGNYKLLTEDWREYTKQRGGPLELNDISIKKLRNIQSRAYLQFYLRPKKLLYPLKSMSLSKVTKIGVDLLRNIFIRG